MDVRDIVMKYDKQDQQGKVAFNERNTHPTKQQEPVARSPGGPQSKNRTGHKGMGRLTTKIINNYIYVIY
jgi:hypothetical protein